MPNVEPIMEIGHDESGTTGWLGIDERGQLYWNEEPVVTEQRIKLDWWVSLAVIVGSLSTFVIAILATLRYLS